jgi:hypothetical protein
MRKKEKCNRRIGLEKIFFYIDKYYEQGGETRKPYASLGLILACFHVFFFLPH